MKKHNTCIFLVTGMVLLACISGIVLADRNPPQTFETQGILITTSVDLDRAPRMVTELKEEEEMIWQQSNRALNGSPLESPWPGFVSGLYLLVPFLGPEFDPIMDPLPGEVQYTVVHTENTQALNGASTSYEKTSTIDTQNRGPGQNNVQVSRNIQFSGGVDGRITSQEKLVVDGAGTFGKGDDSVLCPLSSFGGTHVIPPLESDPKGEFMIVEEDYIPPFSTSCSPRVISICRQYPWSPAPLNGISLRPPITRSRSDIPSGRSGWITVPHQERLPHP